MSPPTCELAPPRRLLETLLGAPVTVSVLKHKPGRRLTARVVGSNHTAIVKVYASDRAATVGARVSTLSPGPGNPVTPRLLALDEGAHAVVLSDVVGEPLRASLLEARLDDCQRAGHALARWHTFWSGRRPGSLRAHSAHRELETLCRRAAASSEVGLAAREAAERLSRPWGCTTVVHRDLYEEQIMLGDRVGLIDLDDAALGPPELDIGNLVAHIELLSIRHRCDVAAAVTALLDGYTAAARLDPLLLNRCRRLSLLRLACLNDDRNLLSLALA